MSTKAIQSYTCSHCRTSYTIDETVEGSFCSQTCYYRHKGEGVISKVEEQSVFCNTCYGKVRDIEPIPDTIHPDGDGYQFTTPLTTIGVDDFSDDPYFRNEGTRWSCKCGAVDPGKTCAELQNIDLKRVLSNFFRAMVYCYQKEAIPNEPDFETYVSAIRRKGRDAAYVAGRAVYA